MNIALHIHQAEFTEIEVSDAVNFALRTESDQARLRRDYFWEQCRSFEDAFQLSSNDFLVQFEAGDLGDDADYFDWYAAKRGLNLWDRRYRILSGVFVPVVEPTPAIDLIARKETEKEAVAEAAAEAAADPPFWFPDENPPPQNLNDLLRETPPEYFVEGYSDAGIPTRAEFESALRSYETAHEMSSIEFYEKWKRGEMPDEIEFIMWAALYEISLDEPLFIDEVPLEEIVGILGE